MLNFFRFFVFLFFIISCAAIPAQPQTYEGRGRQEMSEEAKNDLKIYNEQRKELGMALFYNFSEMYKSSRSKSARANNFSIAPRLCFAWYSSKAS